MSNEGDLVNNAPEAGHCLEDKKEAECPCQDPIPGKKVWPVWSNVKL